MFDFFRDIYLELNGVDSDAAEKERQAKKEQKRKERFIFSGSAKVVAFILGILYLLLAGSSLSLLIESGSLDVFKIIRYVFLILCDIAALVCLAIKKKKTELAALIVMIIFILVQYFTMILL